MLYQFQFRHFLVNKLLKEKKNYNLSTFFFVYSLKKFSTNQLFILRINSKQRERIIFPSSRQALVKSLRARENRLLWYLPFFFLFHYTAIISVTACFYLYMPTLLQLSFIFNSPRKKKTKQRASTHISFPFGIAKRPL